MNAAPQEHENRGDDDESSLAFVVSEVLVDLGLSMSAVRSALSAGAKSASVGFSQSGVSDVAMVSFFSKMIVFASARCWTVVLSCQ